MTIREKHIKIFSKIDQLLNENRIIIVAIDGNSGSGKSSFSEILSHNYDCNVFHMDHFFLRAEQRTAERMAEIGGNIDYERFEDEVLIKLKKGLEFDYSIYNCSLGRLTDKVKVSPKKLNIVEGVYSMHPKLEKYYDLKIFLEVDKEAQKQRILRRNGEYMLQRFLDEWIPMEDRYFEKMKVKDMCHFVTTYP